ncbi:MAG: hypothetical protein ACYDCL_20365 [Myxococcales bacterium]
MKTAISVPDRTFREAERAAKRLGISRSELYSKALSAYLESHRAEDVTEANAVYAGEDSNLDPVLAKMQAAALAR